MSRDYEWVLSTIEETKLNVKVLNRERSKKYIDTIVDKYVKPEHREYWAVWEYLKRDNISSFRDQNGWRYMCDYVKDMEEVYYFADREMVFIVKSKDLEQLLYESSSSNMYVSDKDGTFLLCHNDHAYLIGVGAAADWVKLKESALLQN